MPYRGEVLSNTEEILRQRAIIAAKRLDVSEDDDGINVVYFRIGNEEYAIESEVVSAIHPFVALTPIPYAPSYIQGIFHMRGRFVSVVNLKHFFGMEMQDDEEVHFLLLLGDERMEFCVAVDAVLEHSTLSKTALKLIPAGFDLPRPDLIVGVSEEGVIVLNGKKLLADSAMRVYQEITTSYKGGENVK
jgi:purine-binding chemotaxis protein CheW